MGGGTNGHPPHTFGVHPEILIWGPSAVLACGVVDGGGSAGGGAAGGRCYTYPRTQSGHADQSAQAARD